MPKSLAGMEGKEGKDKKRGEVAPAPVVKRRHDDEPARKDRERERDKDREREREKDRDRERDKEKKRRRSDSADVDGADERATKRRARARDKQGRTPEAEEALAYFAEMHREEDGDAPDDDGPDETEREAMHAYSVELLKMRQKEEVTQRQTAPMKAHAKQLRKQLYDWMVDAGKDIVVLPAPMREAHNAQLEAAGMPPVPPYVRMFRNNKDATILPETVREALDDVTLEDVSEQYQDAADRKKPITVTKAFLLAVVARVRLSIREYTQQVKQLASLPKGTRGADVENAPAEVATWAVKLHTNEHGAKMLEAKRRTADAKRESNLRLLEPLVASYFARAGLLSDAGNASERVMLGGVVYRLVRRVSSVKQPIRFGVIDRALWAAFDEAWHLEVPDEALAGSKGGKEEDEDEGEGEDDDDEPKRRVGGGRKRAPVITADPIASLTALDAMLRDHRADLANSVINTLSNLPPTRKVEIKLYDMAKPRVIKPT